MGSYILLMSVDNQNYRTHAEMAFTKYARDKKLDPSAVIQIFKRIRDINWNVCYPPEYSPFNEAIELSDPETAFKVFTEESVERLAEMYTANAFLADSATPLYELDELSMLIQEFMAHQNSDEEHLLATGYPTKRFDKSLWLDWHLNKLYYSKLPDVVPPISDLTNTDCEAMRIANERQHITFNEDAKGNVIYEYRWLHDPIESLSDLHLHRKSRSNRSCSYDSAPDLPNIDDSMAARLFDLRPEFMKFRNETLNLLVKALKDRSPDKVRQDCLALMSESFSYNDATFLLEVDDHLSRFGTATDGSAASKSNINQIHTSGLIDLFEVIGHIERELTVGTMNNTYSELSKLPVFDSLDNQWRKLAPYFKSLGKKHRTDLHGILEEFIASDRKDKAFLRQYRLDTKDSILGYYGPQTVNVKTGESEFSQFEDYRIVILRGTEFNLNSREADVIRILHEASKGIYPWVSLDRLMTEVGPAPKAPEDKQDDSISELPGADDNDEKKIKYDRLRDIFRNKEARIALIVSRKNLRKSEYKLNIGG